MKALPSIAFSAFSGTAGDVTAKVSKGRQVLSVRATQPHVCTPPQAAARNRLADISRAYPRLTQEQMRAWEELAAHLDFPAVLGQKAGYSGINAFVCVNSSLRMAGLPLRSDAPDWREHIPTVLFSDMWLSPDRVIITGLQPPRETMLLVFRMSPAQSPGTVSAWERTVVITPGMRPDWGDADLTASCASVLGVTPRPGQRYFCTLCWMDAATGLTGRDIRLSLLCRTESIAGNTYVPRNRVTSEGALSMAGVAGADIEVTPGSSVLNADITLTESTRDGIVMFSLPLPQDDFLTGYGYVVGRTGAAGGYRTQTYSVSLREYLGEYAVMLFHLGGCDDLDADILSTGIFFKSDFD